MSIEATVSLSIKDVPKWLVRQLRDQAERNHRSMQGELMTILERGIVGPRPFQAHALRREIDALGLKKTPSESVQWIREDRDR
jgi:antitoxin FitA